MTTVGTAGNPAGFNLSTRMRRFQIASSGLARPVGGGLTSITISKVGYLARLHLQIGATVAGSLSAPNSYGFASIIKRVTVLINSGVQIFDVSGAGYAYMLRDFLDLESFDPLQHTTARTAVTATTCKLDMVIPIAINLRDPIGLIALQNEQAQLTLQINWEADATVATGATVTVQTCNVYAEVFSVPSDPRNWPSDAYVHQILEENTPIVVSTQNTYQWPRGNSYLQLLHGLGYGQASSTPVDSWSAAQIRINQGDYYENTTPLIQDLLYDEVHGRTRLAGVFGWDFLASDGLGNYASTMRDLINSAAFTDLATVVTALNTGINPTQMTCIKRQLVAVAPPTPTGAVG